MRDHLRDDMRDALCEAVDDVYAENFRLSFMSGGKLDPDRPQIEIEAILRVGDERSTNESSSAHKGWHPRISATKAELHVDHIKYNLPKIIVGDKCRALSREGTPLFIIAAIDDRAWPRLILHLGEA